MPINSTTEDSSPEDQSVAAHVDVDLGETDFKKAVSRVVEPSKVDARPVNRERDPDQIENTRAFAKRIGRLKGEMQREFDQRLADIEARQQRELRDLTERVNGLKVQKTNEAPNETIHNSEIAALESQLADAHERGDSKMVAKVTAQISSKNSAFFSAQTRALMGEAYERDQAARQQTQQTTRSVNREDKQDGPTPLGRRFIAANEWWWNDPEYEIERAAAAKIDSQLLREGSDPNSAEHYEELAARLQDKFSKLDVDLPSSRSKDRKTRRDEEDDEDDLTLPRGRQTRAPIAAIQNRGEQRATARRPLRLTADDIAQMKKFKMNPDNDRDVLAWAQEKQSLNGAA